MLREKTMGPADFPQISLSETRPKTQSCNHRVDPFPFQPDVCLTHKAQNSLILGIRHDFVPHDSLNYSQCLFTSRVPRIYQLLGNEAREAFAQCLIMLVRGVFCEGRSPSRLQKCRPANLALNILGLFIALQL